MSKDERTISPSSPWNMFESYQEGQAIYGRDKEIALITESINDNLQTLLYGKSGIGKTSLLQAGVFPNLRKEKFFPIVIRLAFYGDEPLRDVTKRLIEQEAAREDATIGKPKLNVQSRIDLESEDIPLWDYFSRTKFTDAEGNPYIPVLVFDQFEETINNEEHWQRTVDYLRDDVYDLLDNSLVDDDSLVDYSNYRIVISMREDYLYCLEDIIDRYALRELHYNRFRIVALNDNRATEVITRTCGEGGLAKGEEKQIVRGIIMLAKANSGTRFSEINTAMLSLICSLLYDHSDNHIITLTNLRKINSYLSSYYDTITRSVGLRAVRYLETMLLTKDGRRSSVDEIEALSSGRINKKQLQKLEDIRFIKRVKTDVSSARYELVHDYFARMIYKRNKGAESNIFRSQDIFISGMLDRESFIRTWTTTFVVLLIIGIGIAYLGYGSLDFWNYEKIYGLFYFFPLAISVYFIPLLTMRLHDVGESGWYLLLIPISVTLLFMPKIYGMSSFLIVVMTVIAVCSIASLVFLLLQQSDKIGYQSHFSKLIQTTARYLETDWKTYTKVLLYESFIWLFAVTITQIILYYFGWRSYVETPEKHWWCLFVGEKLSYLNTNMHIPALFIMLPLVLMLSHAVRARAKTIGIPVWLCWIPCINIVICIVCFIPDKLLNIGTINKEQEYEDIDGLLIELTHELSVDYSIVGDKKLPAYEAFRCWTIPFYPTIKMLKDSEYVSLHKKYFTISLFKWYCASFILLYVAIESYTDFGVIMFFLCSLASFSSFVIYNRTIHKELLHEAERGSVDSQFLIGVYYYEKKQYDNAIKWFMKASQSGQAMAQYNLAYCYKKGLGVDKDIDESIKWLKMAA